MAFAFDPSTARPDGEFDPSTATAYTPPPKASAARKVADIGLALGQGVVGGVKSLVDVAGTGTAPSRVLGDIGQGIDSLYSQERQAERQARQVKIDAADASGSTLDGITSRLGGFAEAPAQTLAQGIGSMAPTLAAAIATRGKSLVAPLALGIGMGVGGVKGQNYDAVKAEALKQGKTAEEADALAAQASEYSRANAPQQAIGGALGALDAGTGVERVVGKLAGGMAHGADKLLKRVAKNAAEEAIPEGLQGSQGQYAQNEALNNAGFATDAMSGVIGSGVHDAAVGGALGAAAGVPGGRRPVGQPVQAEALPLERAPESPAPLALPAPTPGDPIRAQKLPEAGPLTAAVNVGLENEAQAADAGAPPPVVAPAIPAADTTELTGKAAQRAKSEAEAQQFNEDNQGPTTITAGLLDPGFDTRELSLEGANALNGATPGFRTPVQIAADGAPRILTGDAQELAVDTAEPSAVGLAQTEPTRTRKPAADSTRAMTDADVVKAYVEQRRAEGTLAGRRFAGDFDAGRITPADVLALVKPRAEATPDERLAAAAAQAPQVQPDDLVTADGFPYGTRSGAQARATRDGGSVIEVAGGYSVRPKESASVDVPGTGSAARVPEGARAGGEPSTVASPGAVGPLPTSTGGVQRSAGTPVAGGATAGLDPVGAKPNGALTQRRLKALADSFRKKGTATGKTFAAVLDGYSVDLAAGKITPEQVAPQIRAYTELLRTKPAEGISATPKETANGNEESSTQDGPETSQASTQADDADGQAVSDAQAQDGVKPRTLKDRRAAARQDAATKAEQVPAHAGVRQAATPAEPASTSKGLKSRREEVARLKVFKTRSAAEAARAHGNTHKLQKVKDGFIIRLKTDKELAAEDRNGRRLAGGGVDVERDSLLTAIAKSGGLKFSERSDSIGDGNKNVGGKMLFTLRGKALDDLGTNALQELGYIPPEHRSDPTPWLRSAIKDEFMGRQQYYSDQGTEWVRDTEAAPTDEELAGWTGAELQEDGYTEATAFVQALTEQMIGEAEALGIDTEGVREDAARLTENKPADEYHLAVQEAIGAAFRQVAADAARSDTSAARAGNQDRVEADGAQSQSGASEGLTLSAQTPEELRSRAAREDAASKADATEQKRLGDKAKADAERDEFTLTGSNRAVDVGTAAGQGGLLESPTEPSAKSSDRPSPAPEKTAPAAEVGSSPNADAKAPAARLTDAGEELIRNRRGKLKGLAWDDVSAMNDTLKVAQVVKANVWPRPDYAKMVEEGAPAWKTAALKAVYDKLAAAPATRTTPTDADLRAYIETMQQVRDTLLAELDRVQEVGSGADLWKTLKASNVFGKVFPVPADARPVYGAPSPFDRVSEQGKANNKRAMMIGGNAAVQALQFDHRMLSKVKDLLADGFPAKQEAWQKSYEVRQTDTRDNDVPEAERTGQPQQRFYVHEKSSRWRLAKGGQDGGYATQELAEAFARSLTAKPKKEVLPPSRGLDLATATRTGPDWRAGKDVTAEQVMSHFGFRGVNLGEYVKAKQGVAQVHLNHVYDAFSDMADLLGVPPKAMSLNGTLGVAIGAQGSGKALAHFVPGVNEINITRDSGAGALAHEFGHAVDHYFATQHGRAASMAKRPYLSAVVDGLSDAGGVRSEVMDAMRTVMKTLNARPMTEAEARKYMADQRELNQRRLDRWVKEFGGNKGADKAALAAVAEQLKRGDIGEPQDAAVETNLAEFMRAAGLKPGNAIAGSALSVAYRLRDLADEGRFMATHTPQVDTDYAKASAAMDAKKTAGEGYWSTPWEKFARAFETFTMDALRDRQRESLYLSGLVDSATWQSWASETGKAIPYPAGAERLEMQQAFQRLVDTIQTREDEAGNVALYSRVESPTQTLGIRRRNVLLAAAAAATPAQAATTLGQAKPLTMGVLKQPLSADIAKVLIGNGSGTTNLDGAQATIEALRMLAATGPAEIRALAAQTADLMPTSNLMLTVDTTRAMNAHGAVTWDIGPHMQLFTAGGREGLTVGTFLHEAQHAVVLARYVTLNQGLVRDNDSILAMQAPAAAKALEQFKAVFKEFRAAVGDAAADTKLDKQLRLSIEEARSSPDEFFVRATTDARLQGWMATKVYEGKTLLERFKNWIKRSLFGLSESGVKASWLDAALAASADLSQAMASDKADFARLRAGNKLSQRRDSAQREAMYSRVTPSVPIGVAPSLAERIRNAGGGPKIIGNTGRAYTAELLAAMTNVGFQVQAPTLEERAKTIWKDAGKKLAQGLADQFAPVKDISQEAYGLLRLAKGASGAFEAMLQGGKLKLTDGVYDFDGTQRGGVVDTLLKPLGGEHHDFFRWVAANRAERLTSEGKENLFSPEDIASLKTLADGVSSFDYTIQNGAQAGTVTRDRTLIYADALKTFNAFNKNVLDLAEQSGLIDGEARHLWEHEFYVPFYRVTDEDSSVGGVNIKGSAVRQQAFKTLKGGKQALNADLLDNTLMNWAHLLDASAKNRAAVATLAAAENMGSAVSAPESSAREMANAMGKKSNVVWVMEEGEKHFYVVEDPYLMTALTSLEYAGMRSPVMGALGAFKHALTIGVTASPFFKVRNLIRDSMQAVASAPLSANVAGNLAQGWKLTDQKSDQWFRLLAGGGTIHFGTMMEGNEAKRVQALVESGVDAGSILDSDQKVKAFYRKFVEPSITAYNELGNRGEAINRASLYAQLRTQGMNHAQASLQARDLMDFSMQGSFTSIRFLAQVVPFFNARVQGLYKLGRAAKEDPARFSAVIGAAALASIGLMAAFGDDEDWKKREDWDRNNYWWFKFGGTAFRIPKPFEVGAIATLAERSFEYAFDKEMTSTRFRSNLLTLLGDNLSMNPIPQLVKPMLDVYANKDGFTGRPIETMGMDRLKSEYRFTERTSMTARGISTAANAVTGMVGAQALSPVQVDALLKGYFGWLGSFVVGAGDILARPATDQPARPDSDLFKAATGGMVSNLRDAPSRYVSQMYEQAKEIERAYGTWMMLQKTGKTADAEEFRGDNAELLAKYHQTERVKKAEAFLNQRIRRIEQGDEDGETKRERIRALRERQDQLARPLAATLP